MHNMMHSADAVAKGESWSTPAPVARRVLQSVYVHTFAASKSEMKTRLIHCFVMHIPKILESCQEGIPD